MTPEGKVLAAIVKELRRRNVFYRKLRGSVCQQSGMPDKVLIDRGRTIWLSSGLGAVYYGLRLRRRLRRDPSATSI